MTDLRDLARDIRRVAREEAVAAVTGGKQKQQEGPRGPGHCLILPFILPLLCGASASASTALDGRAPAEPDEEAGAARPEEGSRGGLPGDDSPSISPLTFLPESESGA